MHDSTVFITTTGRGIVRAECGLEGQWSVETYLEEEGVTCLAADPNHHNLVYAGTRTKGMLRSTDRGKTWEPAGLADQIIKSLAVSPHQQGVIYAGTKPPCVFVTRDGGETWSELESFRGIRGRRFWRSPAEPPDWRAYVMGLSVSPADPDVIVAGIEFGAVVRSTDGGQTWSNHLKGTLRDCHSLNFNAMHGDWVYEGGGSGVGASYSRDGGAIWQQPKEGLGRKYGWACAGDPERPEVWYISAGPMGFSGTPQVHKDGDARAHIYRSAGGAPWEQLSGGLPEPLDYMAYALTTDPANPRHVYAGLSNGQVWFSADYGDSWRMLDFNLISVRGDLLILSQ